MIEQFHVQNYKALHEVRLNLTPLHLLIGPNDSGKTSLLEALAALCRSVDVDLVEAFPGAWDGADLVTGRDPQREIRLAADFDSDLHYSIDISFLRTGKVVKLTDEQIVTSVGEWRLSKQSRQRWNKTITKVAAVERSPDATRQGEGALTAQAFDDVRSALSGVQFFRWNPRLLALPAALDPQAGFAMEASGFGLARALAEIVLYDRGLFQTIEDRFRDFFPHIQTIRIASTSAFDTQHKRDELVPMLSKQNGHEIRILFRGHTEDVPASQLSEGVLLVLAYLTILYAPNPPRLLLIEEPENGMHPARLEQIIGLLRELIAKQDHTQVVLTSHSPYVVDQFQPEEVTLCYRTDAGNIAVERLSESETVRREGRIFSLGEIWSGRDDHILNGNQTIPETVGTQP
ncbi:AAA family ATPase [Planctellipticum variicoloris]|uniref:AAA family ATPase n=1 Tax=Planctellipticum variicoloris TaxID=3064265 RepID=UPI002B8B9F38|nr:AAA family ATPase [Planctomycetaceae bacterium SH412]HTN04688.1 AAA family ATPase [Planctomycetaceae bacterium]